MCECVRKMWLDPRYSSSISVLHGKCDFTWPLILQLGYWSIMSNIKYIIWCLHNMYMENMGITSDKRHRIDHVFR